MRQDLAAEPKIAVQTADDDPEGFGSIRKKLLWRCKLSGWHQSILRSLPTSLGTVK